ncbi:unnamed protein product [Heligmosomoides polygyrus]|uniref:FBD domain-containing protein n=1 Tax=Heligmosomoides polygyrus TaxID=6339 RepID=A0A183GK08_HELPZ|nr:unnamed protein product [Heligmosomoides polygyrus]
MLIGSSHLRRPIIALSELKNVDKVLYYGRMVMLAEDLTAALDSDHVSLTTQDASAKQVYWVAKLGEEYFKTHETKNERLTSVYGLFQYVYEREVDNEGARRNSEPRKIRVFGHCCDGRKEVEWELHWRVGKLNSDCFGSVEYYQDEMEKLPKSVWMYLPFDLMNITKVVLIQDSLSSFPEELYSVLAKITTAVLYFEYGSVSEARKILQTISFQSGSNVAIVGLSEEKDEELILPWDRLANFSRLERFGFMVSMSKELLAALDSDHTLLSMDHSLPVPVSCWVEKLVEAYLDRQGDQVRCLRRGAAGYELVKAGKGDAIAHSDVRRRIHFHEYSSNENLMLNELKIAIVVQNIQ